MSDDVILDDIFDNNRAFLPGRRCSRAQVVEHFARAILLDGLDGDEAHLVLSTLPAGADRIYLTPLDKGLSGSKVFSAKFDAEGRRVSKMFVYKLGPKDKIKREYDAVEQLVSPHIHGVGQPVYRVGRSKSLLVQELAGLSSNTSLQSLKNFLRSASEPEKTIQRLLNDRLGSWYHPGREVQTSRQKLGTLFQWYLQKVSDRVYPPRWIELQQWVEAISGCAWKDVDGIITGLRDEEVTSRVTTVHGDLHSQNVLVDEREECWPIDFAWCRADASPVLDYTMLECSLKFLAIPQRCDLHTLIRVEGQLCSEAYPAINVGMVPYCVEIENVLRAIFAVRHFATEDMAINFADYRKALCLMTYAHSTHPMLNLPYILASLQILTAKCSR